MPTVEERFASCNSITGYQECATQIILEGVAAAKADDDAEHTEAGDYLTDCLKATFGFDDSKEPNRAERLRAKYTIAILLSCPKNRDIIVKMMTDDWILSEMITKIGDADGSTLAMRDTLRVNARATVNAVVEQIDHLLKARDVADVPGDVSMDDSSERDDARSASSSDTSSDDSDDEIIKHMLNARIE